MTMSIVFFVLFFLFIAALFFLVIELCARWYLRRSKYYVCTPNKEIIIEANPDIMPTVEPKVLYTTNSIGERGSEPPSHGAFFKVLCCGGSSMESMFLDQRSSLDGQIEAGLMQSPGFEACRVQVGNIGKSLTDALTLNEMFRKIFPQYKHIDAIVILLGASEVVRWLESGAPATGALEEKAVRDIFAQHPEVPFAFNRSDLALRKLLGRHRSQKPQTFKNAGRKYQEMRNLRANAVSTIESVPESGAFIQNFSAAFKQTLELAQDRAPIVIVACQPWFDKDRYSQKELSQFWHGSIGNPYIREVNEFYSPQVISSLMHKVNDEVKRLCDEAGVPSIDCPSIVTSTLDYYYDQIHFLASGSELIAAEITRVISEEARKSKSKAIQ